MDALCRLRQPNVFCHGEGTGYNSVDRVDSHILLRSREFGRNVLGKSQINLKAQLHKKTKKFTCLNGHRNSNLTSGKKYNCHLCSWNSRISLLCSYDNVLKCPRAFGLRCQSDDSLAFVNGNGRNVEFLESNDDSSKGGPAYVVESSGSGEVEGQREQEEEMGTPSLDELRELLQKAMKELEVARLNSIMFEKRAQKISEAAISLQDEAASARSEVNSTLDSVQQIVNEEAVAKEAVQKATMALSLAEARLQVAMESLEVAKGRSDFPQSSQGSESLDDIEEEEKTLLIVQKDFEECKENLEKCEAQFRQLQIRKEESQKEVDKLNEVAEKASLNALKAEEDVANIMLLAEQAVAFELEATQRVNDAEIALQRTEKSISISHVDTSEITEPQILSDDPIEDEEKVVLGISGDTSVEWDRDVSVDSDSLVVKPLSDSLSGKTTQSSGDLNPADELSDHENGMLKIESLKESEVEAEKSKNVVQSKKQEAQKDLTKESSSVSTPKALNKSSRFFSASFFSFTVDGAEFTPASVFQGFTESVKKQWPKLIVGLLLFGAGYVQGCFF